MDKNQDKIQKLAHKFIISNVFEDQTDLVWECLDKGVFYWDDIENRWIEKEGKEFFVLQEAEQWIFVEPHIAELLEKHKEPVLFNKYGQWWGRMTGAQPYSNDDVIHDMVKGISYK